MCGWPFTKSTLFKEEIQSSRSLRVEKRTRISLLRNRTQAASGPDTGRSGNSLRHNEYVTHAITRDPEIMHGVPVFTGTRVPVETLFEYLEGGDTLEDFLMGFPTVSRNLALQALEDAKRLLLART